MDSRLGQQIRNYRIIEFITSGGFSEVYKAQHIDPPHREVAIKFLHAHLANIGHRELNILLQLRHPNIVSVLDYGTDNGIPYIIEEYMAHGDLTYLHSGGTPLLLETVVSYVNQVASALQYAHDRRPMVLHRDIKPGNMLLGENGWVFLSDFSIAAAVRQTPFTLRINPNQLLPGEYTYMPPEQFRGETSRASDQYSLGVVVYEWLCGKPPFQGNDPQELYTKHAHQPPPPMVQVSPQVEAVVMKALAKKPKERHRSVWEFATALERAAQEASVTLGQVDAISVLNASATAPEIVPLAPPLTFILSRRGLLMAAAALAVGGGILARLSITPLLTTYTQHKGPVLSVVWSPDGRLVASTDLTELHIWDPLHPEKPLRRYPIQRGTVPLAIPRVVWSPKDNNNVAYIGSDATLDIRNAFTGIVAARFHAPDKSHLLFSLAWSPTQEHLFLSIGSQVLVFDTNEPLTDSGFFRQDKSYLEHTGNVRTIASAPDNLRVASGGEDKTVHVWVAETSTPVIPPYSYHNAAVLSVAWSADGKQIASADAEGTVLVWPVDGPLDEFAFPYQEHKGAIYSLVWSPDNQWIASGGADRTARVWSPDTRQTLYSLKHGGNVTSLAWSRGQNGVLYLASASWDKTVRIWGILSDPVLGV